MWSDIIVVFIGIVLIAIGLMGFKKEMTLINMECKGTKIEKEKSNMQLAKNIIY